eukprot:3362512-Pleurochrysis_carterae.AAC.2
MEGTCCVRCHIGMPPWSICFLMIALDMLMSSLCHIYSHWSAFFPHLDSNAHSGTTLVALHPLARKYIVHS